MNKLYALLFMLLINTSWAQVPSDSNINASKEDLQEVAKVKRDTGTNYRVFIENDSIHVNEICNCYPMSLGLYDNQEYRKEKIRIKGVALKTLVMTNKDFKKTNVNSANLNISSVRMQRGLENYFKEKRDVQGILIAQLILTVSHKSAYQLTEKDISSPGKRKIWQEQINKNNLCNEGQCYSYFLQDYSIINNDNKLTRSENELIQINKKIEQKYNPKDLRHLDFAESSPDQIFKIYEIQEVNKYQEKLTEEQTKMIAKKIKEMDE